MSSASNRAEWVDCARTLAMFFIIWLHADAAPVWVGKVVGGAIALFFLLAGYFLPSAVEQVLRRTGRLALAWCAWSLLSLIFLLVFKPYVEIEWQKVLGWGVAAYNTPLWFLKTLIAYQLVAAILIAAGILPRYGWILVVFLALCSYTTSPSQHLSIRFDYLWIFMLGFSVRGVSLDAACSYIWKNGVVLVLVVAGAFLQPEILEEYADWRDVSWRHCNLPLKNLAFMVSFLLAGVALVKSLPRIAGQLAVCGRWMLFIYAGHSYLLSPLYCCEDIRWAWNIWVPVLILPVMVGIGRMMTRMMPAAMRVLQAGRWK